MTRKIRTNIPAPVVLPKPEHGYSEYYMNNLIKQLQSALDGARTPAILVGGELFLFNIPSRGAGLPPGSVYQDSGVLKIVRESDILLDTYSMSVAVGTVVVTN